MASEPSEPPAKRPTAPLSYFANFFKLPVKTAEIIRLEPSQFTPPQLTPITEEEFQAAILRYQENNKLSNVVASQIIQSLQADLSQSPFTMQKTFEAAKPSLDNNSDKFIDLQARIKASEEAYHITKERPQAAAAIQTLSDYDKQLIPRLLITSDEIAGLSTSLSLEQIEEEKRIILADQNPDNKRQNQYKFANIVQIEKLKSPQEVIFNSDNFSPIVNKLNICRNFLLSNNLINHKVNCSIYNDVFFTSDIHADLRKFIGLLYSGGFIDITDNFDPYTDDIYNPNFIDKIRWIKNNSLLIIIGDLVDGTRDGGYNGITVNTGTVNDKIGNFELLLHILIYNLRLQALLLNSNILFTYGNHDMMTIFKNTDIYIKYVSPETKKYFYNSMTLRTNVLKYFYALSPYILLQLSTPSNNREILCVHGGLHTNQTTNLFNKFQIVNFLKFQEILSLTGIFGIDICREYNYRSLSPDNKNNMIEYDSIYKSNEEYVLYKEFKEHSGRELNSIYYAYFLTNANWDLLFTRFYTEDNQSVCQSIQDFGDDIKMIVVGHCPTDGYESLRNIMETNSHLYEHCEMHGKREHTKGCVVSNCSDNQNPGAPKLALVDTAMSSAFRNRNIAEYKDIRDVPTNLSDEEKLDASNINKNRHNEMLHLRHDPTLGGINKYYNVVLRLILPNIIPNPTPTEQININTEPHEIVLYKALPKDIHANQHKKQMKYLKYKLKYYYLVQKN